MRQRLLPRAKLAAAVLIWGSIGLFVRRIPLSSSVIALVRGGVGTLFLLLFQLLSRKRLQIPRDAGSLLWLLVSGCLIGFNWILLFEAYRHTTVASATLCYYMAPVFVLLAAPVVLREALTRRKLLCILAAFVGILLISGIFSGEPVGLWGLLLGLGAAALYAAVILINKQISVTGLNATILQLALATMVLLPYTMLTEELSGLSFSGSTVLGLALLGIVHTGIAYGLYFSALPRLPSQTIALYSYLDPLSAILLSAVFLREPLGPTGILGAILILGATLLSELTENRGSAAT